MHISAKFPSRYFNIRKKILRIIININLTYLIINYFSLNNILGFSCKNFNIFRHKVLILYITVYYFISKIKNS